MKTRFWNKKIETLKPGALSALRQRRFLKTLAAARRTPFYKKRIPRAVRSLKDLGRIPFTTKDDLRQGFPGGFLAVPLSETVRVHTTSGTTGAPAVIHHSRADIAKWAELCARCMTATGASHRDVFQNMMTYGLFTGGLGLHYGAELMGMTVIPAGAGNTRRQIRLMQDFKTTAVHVTPSYLLHMGLEMEKQGLDPKSLNLKRAFIGAEPHAEALRKRIETLFNINAYNSYGLCEMNGPGVAFECVCKNGMHLWEDAYLLEIINPETLSPVPEGEEGELVLTTLGRAATPLLRYRTRDLTRLLPGPCPCGRTHRRIARIKGRSDDMMIINGVNVFPSQVESVLMAVPGAGGNYRIRLEKKGPLDVMALDVEVDNTLLSGDRQPREALKDSLREAVKSAVLVNPEIEFLPPGGLPAPAGKAVRVKDNR